jgi:hypothetical protein
MGKRPLESDDVSITFENASNPVRLLSATFERRKVLAATDASVVVPSLFRSMSPQLCRARSV